MHRKLTASITGALLSLALIVPTMASASSPPPPTVFVRIEGASATLLAQTAVQTTTATKVKGEPCSGSSAGGALQDATNGSWRGSYSSKYKDFLVDSILGETPTGSNYWTLWVNGISSSTGACSTPLHEGDRELWFDCLAGGPPNYSCTNNPLALTAPATARLRHRVTISVVQLDGAGHGTPFAGAAVSGPGVAAVTGSKGKATIVPGKAGVIELTAAESGATPSDPVFVCVYASTAKTCGRAGASGPPVHVIGIAEHEVFVHGPRELRGTAGPDPSGLTDVSLSLLRRTGGKCSAYDATSGTWHAEKCGASAPLFSVGADASWSYLLPSPLSAGSYRLDVVARDGNGRQTKVVTGVSGIDFAVAAKH
jgi:hypothetical protein